MGNRIDIATGNNKAASSYNVLADNNLLVSAKLWYHFQKTNALSSDGSNGSDIVPVQRTPKSHHINISTFLSIGYHPTPLTFTETFDTKKVRVPGLLTVQ